MIVRINQCDAAKALDEAAWTPNGLRPIVSPWLSAGRAFEILVLNRDESGGALAEDFRRQQMRHLLPQTFVALKEPGEQIVVRLEGPLMEGGLLTVFNQLTEANGGGRFVVQRLAKLDAQPSDVTACITLQTLPPRFAALCGDALLALDQSVRLIAFAAAEEDVEPLLTLADTDEARFDELARKTRLVLTAAPRLRALHVFTRALETAAVRSRLTQRLAAAAAARRSAEAS